MATLTHDFPKIHAASHFLSVVSVTATSSLEGAVSVLGAAGGGVLFYYNVLG